MAVVGLEVLTLTIGRIDHNFNRNIGKVVDKYTSFVHTLSLICTL